MVLIKDNFLDIQTFDWLYNLANQKSSQALQNIQANRIGKSKFYTKDNTAWDYSDQRVTLNLIQRLYGEPVFKIYNKIKDECQQNNIELLDFKSIFFLFATTGYTVPMHRDKNLLHSTLDDLSKIYKAFIFCHKVWKPEWKGELCFEQGNYLPMPNRLLIYSGNERHWVEQVQDIGDNIRMIFGIRFGDEVLK